MKKIAKKKNVLMELTHDAIPGYGPAFMAVFTVSLSYLAYILSQPCFII